MSFIVYIMSISQFLSISFVIYFIFSDDNSAMLLSPYVSDPGSAAVSPPQAHRSLRPET